MIFNKYHCFDDFNVKLIFHKYWFLKAEKYEFLFLKFSNFFKCFW